MEILKDRIEDTKHMPMQRLQEECNYWTDKMSEFQQIEETMKKVAAEVKNLSELEKLFHELKLRINFFLYNFTYVKYWSQKVLLL